MDLETVRHKMDGALEALRKEFTGLRTGRASVSLLDSVKVEAYGSMVPINQAGSINTPEPRLLTVQVWDAGLIKAVEKAIRDSGLGLNPQPDGNLIRIPMPELSQERRQELVKIAGKYTEQAKVAVRNVRRDALDGIKKAKLPEDETKSSNDKVQKVTDEFIGKIEEMFSAKEKEIIKV
ncbi:MAG: ribosome recycling factor [Alphaproteobacteria bacterium]|nr:ribosome recycling factor [Alphaproteobacteria bacterium]MCL2505813.1 ribosome recycling factor [Alphaproteobacteria bacterium]